MENHIMIMNTITNIFNGSDRRDWDMVRDSFHYQVFLDYFSLNNKPGEKIKSEEIVQGWTEFLTKFTFTHHVITNFEVTASKELASVFCKGSALHYFPNSPGGDTWTTIGTYNFTLAKIAGYWKVNSIIFKLVYEEGNKNLPAIVASGNNDNK